MTHVALALLLQGCQFGFTLPSDTPAPSGPLTPGQTLPIRLRRGILPGKVTGPPPPDAGITADSCGAMKDGGPVEADGCTTGTISCGDVKVGDTIGGVNLYNSRFYEQNFCTPATTNHNGGDERVYRLDLPEQTRALVYLDTPCADLDLAAVKYSSGAHCPSKDSNIPQCEENRKNGTAREQVDLWNDHPSTWWLIVEGVDDNEGAFSLTVQCQHLNLH